MTGGLDGVNAFVDTGQDGAKFGAYRVRPFSVGEMDKRLVALIKLTVKW